MTISEKVDKILMIVSRVEPMVQEHHDTLYGNSKPGLKEDVALLNLKWKDCPARKAATTEGKRLNLAYVAVVIAIISCATSVVAVVSVLAGR